MNSKTNDPTIEQVKEDLPKAQLSEEAKLAEKEKAKVAKEKGTASFLDTVKWVFIFALLTVAIAGNYIYAEESVLIRAVAVVVLVAISGLIALQTEKGRNAAIFAKEARTEVRKVVWPTRQEAVQTTGIVLVVTLLMSLLLWGLDSFLFWLVGLVTGLQV